MDGVLFVYHEAPRILSGTYVSVSDSSSFVEITIDLRGDKPLEVSRTMTDTAYDKFPPCVGDDDG